MASFSIGAAWEDMVGFVRRESGILVPVSMATFGVAAMLLAFVVPQGLTPGSPPPPDAGMLLMIPAMLLLALGNLAVTILALVPGTSVGEAFRRAALRLPRMIAAGLLLCLVLMCALLLASVVVAPFARNVTTAALIITPVVVILLFAFAVPAVLLSPVVAIESVSPVGALRRVAELARGNVVRLFAIICLVILMTLTVSLIATVVITAVVKLATLVSGALSFVTVLGDIVLAAISALLSMANAAYIAFAYRRMLG